MIKPTQDTTLKKYLMKSIQREFGNVDYEVETQFTIKKLDKLAAKILRHLNDLGYVQMTKPSIADDPQFKKSDVTTYFDKQDEYFTGIMKHE